MSNQGSSQDFGQHPVSALLGADCEVRCSCQAGRDHDGSEFGPCAYCEHQADVCAAAELDLQGLLRDAARWRFTRRDGYRINRDFEFSDVESNRTVIYLGNAMVGVGHDEESAVDCAMALTALHGDRVPVNEVIKHWREWYARRFEGGRWIQPSPADGALGRQDGPVSSPGMNTPLHTPQPEQLHGEEQ